MDTSTRPQALAIIQDEHQALAAMLTSMRLLVEQSARRGDAPPFDVMRAMLLYVDEFPERRHHKQESALLFPMLRARCPGLAGVLDRLDREHAAGERAIRELEHALLAYEVLGDGRRAAFQHALDRYIDFYLQHMRLEEDQVLPAAREVLTPADRVALDAAFAAHRDPLTGHEPTDEYRPLFRRIVMTAPAPIGLG